MISTPFEICIIKAFNKHYNYTPDWYQILFVNNKTNYFIQYIPTVHSKLKVLYNQSTLSRLQIGLTSYFIIKM